MTSCIVLWLDYNIRSIQYWVVLNQHCKVMSNWGCSWIVSRPSIVAESISYIHLHKLLKKCSLIPTTANLEHEITLVTLSCFLTSLISSTAQCDSCWSSQFSYSDEHDGILHLYAKILTSEGTFLSGKSYHPTPSHTHPLKQLCNPRNTD